MIQFIKTLRSSNIRCYQHAGQLPVIRSKNMTGAGLGRICQKGQMSEPEPKSGRSVINTGKCHTDAGNNSCEHCHLFSGLVLREIQLPYVVLNIAVECSFPELLRRPDRVILYACVCKLYHSGKQFLQHHQHQQSQC